MLCKDVEVIIVKSYENIDNKLSYKSLDTRINRVLEEHGDKSLVDVKVIDNKKAMIIITP